MNLNANRGEFARMVRRRWAGCLQRQAGVFKTGASGIRPGCCTDTPQVLPTYVGSDFFSSPAVSLCKSCIYWKMMLPCPGSCSFSPPVRDPELTRPGSCPHEPEPVMVIREDTNHGGEILFQIRITKLYINKWSRQYIPYRFTGKHTVHRNIDGIFIAQFFNAPIYLLG